MIHLTTEIGKPGLKEREKKHFDQQFEQSEGDSKIIRNRRHIEHGYCAHDDTYWKPHYMPVEPKFTDEGPDWKSSIRCIPSPKNENKKNEELWPEKSTHIRTYPGSSGCSAMEWQQYTNGYLTGKKCFFESEHKRSAYGCDSIDFDSTMGCKRKEWQIDKRNGFWTASHGDNMYQAAEYEPDFFKNGSSIPPVNFGGPGYRKTDTFIPLFSVPKQKKETYAEKERRRLENELEKEVAALDQWQPAPPLTQVQPVVTNTIKGK